MTDWTESKTVDGTIVRSRELAPDARHKVSGSHQWVVTVHPYDLARYHYAHSRDGMRWDIYRDAPMTYAGMTPRGPEYIRTEGGSPEHILWILRELDKSVAAHIDLS